MTVNPRLVAQLRRHEGQHTAAEAGRLAQPARWRLPPLQAAQAVTRICIYISTFDDEGESERRHR